MVVYAVLCHRAPRAVAELARRLHHPGHHLILHADRKAPAVLHDLLARLGARYPDIHVLDSQPCAWGGWSLVAATLRAIALALALPGPWRHFVLLSERHVPLQPPATIAASLPDGASFIEARSLTRMDRPTRADLLHRFARHSRELPGVGMFAGDPRPPDPALTRRLRLGSQWVVLARAACERLIGTRDDTALWAPFRASLVPDETALHSVLRGTAVGAGLDIRDTALTFTAWPHLGGGADSAFTDAQARAARARGHLFIRKRPPRLPPFTRALLATMPMRPAPPLANDPPAAPEGDAVALAATLGGMLRGRFPGLSVRASASADDGPACFLWFRATAQAGALVVCLLSQDLRAFKVLLAWRRRFDFSLAPIGLGGYATTVMGARLPGLGFAREVHLPELPDHGFAAASDGATDELAARLAVALAVARRLSVLVADAA
jgi:hypothetical protein